MPHGLFLLVAPMPYLGTSGAPKQTRRDDMENATNQALTIDRDKINIRKSVAALMHILDDFIPDGCRRDAQDALERAFFDGGIELTDKSMRKEYEAWKALTPLLPQS